MRGWGLVRRSSSRLADPPEIPSRFIMSSDRSAREGAGRGVAGGLVRRSFVLAGDPPEIPSCFIMRGDRAAREWAGGGSGET